MCDTLEFKSLSMLLWHIKLGRMKKLEMNMPVYEYMYYFSIPVERKDEHEWHSLSAHFISRSLEGSGQGPWIRNRIRLGRIYETEDPEFNFYKSPGVETNF